MADEQLIAASGSMHLARNGVPTAEQQEFRTRAYELVRAALAHLLGPEGMATSPLGPGWTDVFAVQVHTAPDAEDLNRRGWLHLDHLFHRLGLVEAAGRWAVVEHGRVLAGVRISGDGPGDPVDTVTGRSLAHGEVRLRDVLELRELRRQGRPFPTTSQVLRIAADIESELGGRELARWTSGRRPAAPARVSVVGRGGTARLVVGCSGVDGAGKTTMMDNLARDLSSAGVPLSRVWLRPGMGLGWVASLADRTKRLMRIDPRPGVGLIASQPGAPLRSRRGVLGWAWSMLVTVAFITGLRRQHAASHGVVLYDRHLADALATLDFAYAGSDLRLQRWLVRAFTPTAASLFHLDVPVHVALERKPGDMIGEAAIRGQLDAYDRWLPTLPDVHRLDGTRPSSQLAREALDQLLAGNTRGHSWTERPLQ